MGIMIFGVIFVFICALPYIPVMAVVAGFIVDIIEKIVMPVARPVKNFLENTFGNDVFERADKISSILIVALSLILTVMLFVMFMREI